VADVDSSWLFNLGAEVYGWFTAQAAWQGSCARLADRLADLDEPGQTLVDLNQRGRTIVDLGCGPGVSTFALAARLPAARLIGLDRAPRMLAEARRRQRRFSSARRIVWLEGDSAALPFAAGSLDACTGHSFLYLVDDRRATLAELTRVLTPGGRLVLMEPNARAATVAQVLQVSRDPRHLLSVSLWRPFSRLHGRFTRSSLQTTLERAGFVRCEVEETLNGLGLLATAAAPP
jgi:SAM-dependent methyltransferase